MTVPGPHHKVGPYDKLWPIKCEQILCMLFLGCATVCSMPSSQFIFPLWKSKRPHVPGRAG